MPPSEQVCLLPAAAAAGQVDAAFEYLLNSAEVDLPDARWGFEWWVERIRV